MDDAGQQKTRNPLRKAGFCTLLDFPELSNGAGGRNRTDMTLRSLDFESSASTSFTTPALGKTYTVPLPLQSSRKGGGCRHLFGKIDD